MSDIITMTRLESSHPDYQSYLLRVWRDESRGLWRASLQNTVTKRIYHFADADKLLEFLSPTPPVTPSTDDERISG
ncbi:MAG: hypothetical protein HC853_09550 [Anaerolineae bacterium]|nr:hypothetical protein [Anaerolineae bacterium]